MTEKLEPCPFCGSENVRFESEKHAVVCMRCKSRGCAAPTREMSLDMWNDRVGDDHAELVVRLNVSDEQVRRMVDEAVSAAIESVAETLKTTLKYELVEAASRADHFADADKKAGEQG